MIGTSVIMVRRVATDRSSTTAGVSSAAALRLRRGMIAVRTVTPSTPYGSCRSNQAWL